MWNVTNEWSKNTLAKDAGSVILSVIKIPGGNSGSLDCRDIFSIAYFIVHVMSIIKKSAYSFLKIMLGK